MSRYSIVILIVLVFVNQVLSQSNDDMEEGDSLPNNPKTSTNETFATPSSSTLVDPPKKFPNNLGSWNFSWPSSENSSCIIIHGALQLRLNSSVIYGNDTVLKIDVPPNPKGHVVGGTCGEKTQRILLEWESNTNTSRYEYDLEIQFGFLPTNINKYDIQEFILRIKKFNAKTEQKTAEANITLDTEGPYFPTNIGQSFLCNSRNVVSGKGNLTVATAFLQFEAFRPNSTIGQEFSEATVCSMDKSSKGAYIGIAVGSFLVIIVATALGVYVGMRYGYCRCLSCCKRGNGYQRLDI